LMQRGHANELFAQLCTDTGRKHRSRGRASISDRVRSFAHAQRLGAAERGQSFVLRAKRKA
jgi:hypothetical protein